MVFIEFHFEKDKTKPVYQFKVNTNTRTRCETVQILIIKTQERHYWRRSAVFIVKFEHIFTSFCSANFEHVVAG